jgi:hypothetical protein
MIRILVVHPTQLVCSLYASVIDDRPSLEVVARATTKKEALKKVEAAPVILSWSRPVWTIMARWR